MKLGIIGSGMIVEHLLQFVHDIDDIELVHISGTKRSEDKVKKIKEEHDFKRYSTDYEELLDDQEVDTIYVALPNHLHYEYTKKALQANKHVILEKPFTSTIEEAEELLIAEDAAALPMYQQGNTYLIDQQVKGIETHSVGVPFIYKNVTIEE